MKFLISFILLIFVSEANAQNVEWAKTTWGGQLTRENSMITDSVGNCYVTGNYWQKKAEFDGFLLDTNSTQNIFVAKYDLNGNVKWAVNSVYSGQGGNYPGVGSIDIDSKGNIYIIGDYYYGDIAFGDFKLENRSDRNIYMFKFSNEGEALWAKQFGNKGSAVYSPGLKVDKDDNIYIAGIYTFYAPLFLGDTSLSKENNGITPTFLAKLSESGDVLWAKSDIAGRMQFGSDGSIYLSSQYQHYIVWKGDTIKSIGGPDHYVAKINKNGKEVWLITLASSEYDYVYDLQIDNDDNIYILGKFGEQSRYGGVSVSGINRADYQVLKFDSDGKFKWTQSIELDSSQYNSGMLLFDLQDQLYFLAEKSEIITQENYWTYTKHGVDFLRIDLDNGMVINQDLIRNIPMPSAIGVDKYENKYLYGQFYNSQVIQSNWLMCECSYARYLFRLEHFNPNFDRESSILVYPNPVGNELKIELSKFSKFPIKCNLFNSLGSSMQEFEIKNYYTTEEVVNLPSGIYYLQVGSSPNQKVIKVIKN